MSELKVRPYTMLPSGQCYDRDEVDKVIAEKDKQLRHQKYKRCLAMARWCASRVVVWTTDGNERKSDWYWKWKERWKNLADKFKEAK